MNRRIAILASVVGLGFTAAGASAIASPDAAPASADRSCFFASQVDGWRSEKDEKTVYLEVGPRKVYRAELFSRCSGVDDALTLGVQARGGGSSICDGMDVELLVSSPIGPQRCHVTKLTKLTAEEIQALKAKKK